MSLQRRTPGLSSNPLLRPNGSIPRIILTAPSSRLARGQGAQSCGVTGLHCPLVRAGHDVFHRFQLHCWHPRLGISAESPRSQGPCRNAKLVLTARNGW